MAVGTCPTASRGHFAFLQGMILGATSPNGPIVQARAIFGGVAPARKLLRSRGPIRPGHLTNSLPYNELDESHLLRLGRLSRPEGRAFARFPRTIRAPRKLVNYGDGESLASGSAPLSQCGRWRGIRVLPISPNTLGQYVVDGKGSGPAEIHLICRIGSDPPVAAHWRRARTRVVNSSQPRVAKLLLNPEVFRTFPSSSALAIAMFTQSALLEKGTVSRQKWGTTGTQ